jgi:UDP-GlcNAc:undecaprenyl-phosphate GlcNAc-1-phosphate transferase
MTAGLLSLAFGLILVPTVRKLSFRLGVVATPRVDRWHSKPTPKFGGVGIFLAFAFTIAILYFFNPIGFQQWPLLAGASLIFLLGVIDDFKRISPPAKLVGEIIAAAIIVFYGRNIDFFEDEFFNILFTFIWLVGITNAINLLDNMDGLAGGVALIAAGLLGVLFWQSGTTDLLLISLALAGSTLGFLVFNFPPASIFMGDSGSLFLGFTLSSLAIARVPQASNLLAVMGVPTLIFLLPILDTTLVTITRVLRGQSIAQGGRDHTSHRLIAFGLSERQAVLILYGVAIIAGVFGVVIESIDYAISLILIPILLITLTLLTAYLGRLKVVLPDTLNEQRRDFASMVINLTYRGRIPEIALDFFLISITYYLAYWIHFGTQVDIISMEIFLSSLPIALAGSYISFFIFGIYRGVWQYLDIRDLFRYGRAVGGSVLLISGVMSLVYYPLGISLRIFVIFVILLFLGLVLSRSSFTILDRVYTQYTQGPQKETSVLIYGAGEEGVRILQWMLHDPGSLLNPVGFIDNDPYYVGRQILSIRVYGNIHDIKMILEQIDYEGILISSESGLNDDQLETLSKSCSELGIWLKRLRIEFEEIN